MPARAVAPGAERDDQLHGQRPAGRGRGDAEAPFFHRRRPRRQAGGLHTHHEMSGLYTVQAAGHATLVTSTVRRVRTCKPLRLLAHGGVLVPRAVCSAGQIPCAVYLVPCAVYPGGERSATCCGTRGGERREGTLDFTSRGSQWWAARAMRRRTLRAA